MARFVLHFSCFSFEVNFFRPEVPFNTLLKFNVWPANKDFQECCALTLQIFLSF